MSEERLYLQGATVEVIHTDWVVIRWQGYAAIAPLNHGEYAVFVQLDKVRCHVEAEEKRRSAQTQPSRAVILAQRREAKERALKAKAATA